MNLCRSCRCDFASVSAFDRHRIGKHAYTFAQGLRMEPPREDGRRCMDELEMRAAGMRPDSRSRWRIEADAERAASMRMRTESAREASGVHPATPGAGEAAAA